MNHKLAAAILGLVVMVSNAAAADKVWPADKADAWYNARPFLAGCNYIPSNAINQLEMWQADTFDPAINDRELGWAAGLGFNSMRVFLHNIPFEQDREGFFKRMDQFLAICDKHKIGVLFVFFDACWDPMPKPGKQRDPRPHVHNSGWVQCPGHDIIKDPSKHDSLKPFVQETLRRFKDDARIHGWDLFNEPDNINGNSYKQKEPANKKEMALALLAKAFEWAREVNPSQPLTSGVWIGNWPDPAKLSPMERLQLENSDVISFHCYGKPDDMKKCVDNLKRFNRPILCTEYMSRGSGSLFDPILGYLKEQKVAAYNWGLVNGKTNTIYPWDSWQKKYTVEPELWFHDIFRADGSLYRAEERAYIKKVMGKDAK